MPSLSAGVHAGTIEVRACRDAACAQTYANASASVPYTLDLATVAEWETHQRDTAHRGYVPIWLKPAQFAVAWTWQRPDDPEPIGGVNAVVTRAGKVYLTHDVYFGEGALVALNEDDGTQAWRKSFGVVPALGPPAVKDGTVYAATTGHQDTFLWAFDADTGTYRWQSAFAGQWPHTLAPTVYAGQVFVGAGYYGGVTYSFPTAGGAFTWEHSAGGAWDMFTPAVDDQYVYHHSGDRLFVIDRANGATVKNIDDPFGAGSGYSYHGAPMLGSRGNAVSFADGAFSGRASSSTEHYDQRVLSSFDVENGVYEWSTSYAYLTAPATANGVIYAARNNPMSLDAIDEETGQVLWSWAPAGQGDTSFHRNIVLTRNLLFVSTDVAVYALDLQSRTVAWRHPRPGMLAISASRTLYIVTGARESDGGVTAIRLRR